MRSSPATRREMSMTRSKTTVVMLLAVGLCLVVALASAQQAKRGGTLQVSLWVEHMHLDTRLTPYQLSSFLLGNIHSSLVRLDKDLKPIPDLAERWEMKEGGRVWTFQLVPGVKFHDGSPADAAAVSGNSAWLVASSGWTAAL